MSQEIRRRLEARQRLAGRVPPAELAIPRFSAGVERSFTAEDMHVGRFSEGHEALRSRTPAKEHVGRFSEGCERRPDDDPSKLHVGRFSDGAEAHSPPAA